MDFHWLLTTRVLGSRMKIFGRFAFKVVGFGGGAAHVSGLTLAPNTA